LSLLRCHRTKTPLRFSRLIFSMLMCCECSLWVFLFFLFFFGILVFFAVYIRLVAWDSAAVEIQEVFGLCVVFHL
jgi:hypothetical protein